MSPLVRAVDNGWFASTVSIRCQQSGGNVRLLHLTRLFRCALQAAAYAHAEARQWISAGPSPLPA